MSAAKPVEPHSQIGAVCASAKAAAKRRILDAASFLLVIAATPQNNYRQW